MLFNINSPSYFLLILLIENGTGKVVRQIEYKIFNDYDQIRFFGYF